MSGGQRSLTVTRLRPVQRLRGRRVAPDGRAPLPRSARAPACSSPRADTWCSRSRVTAASGTGLQSATACLSCGGQQFDTRTETADDGGAGGAGRRRAGSDSRQGACGTQRGDPGDVFLTVRVEPHPVFRREGDDLHVVVPVAIHEAALGAKLDVPTLDGPARLRVPPGTQSGQRFRLRERGVPSARTGRRGRSRRRGAPGAAASARRALEGAPARIRPAERRRRAQGPASDG